MRRMSGIVTLLPAATEIVCALGLRDRLVGQIARVRLPGGVEALPALTRARVDSSAASGEIDRRCAICSRPAARSTTSTRRGSRRSRPTWW